MKKRFAEHQIVAILEQGEAGVTVKEICRKHNISDATFYTWRKKYRGMETEDLHRLKQLEAENRKLERLRADPMLDNDALRAALSKKYWPHGTSAELPLGEATMRCSAAGATDGVGHRTQALWISAASCVAAT